ncbi:MAG TPA: hypothetical protein PLN13_10330 [Bacteroidia bacterium]|nr:hypothetical protein [Bacteroidia bacterium]HRH08968.1 hypothetical protein [Bacteroidia bacterium]
MKKIATLSESLAETIKNSDLKNIGIDISEALLDSELADGILKEIPILNSIYGLHKAATSIQDNLFTKKLQAFLKNAGEIEPRARKEIVDKIDNDPKYKTKVGEKLLFIIERCEDTEKANWAGKLFKGLLEGKLDYLDFLRASKCIELVFGEDLKVFINGDRKSGDFEDVGDMVASGLFTAVFEPGENQLGRSGGSMKCYITGIGEKIREILKVPPRPPEIS